MEPSKRTEHDGNDGTSTTTTPPEAAPAPGVLGFFERALDRMASSRARAERARDAASQRNAYRQNDASYGEYGRGFAAEDPRHYADGGQGFGRVPTYGAAYGHGDLSRADERGWGEAPAGAYRDDRDDGLALRPGGAVRDPREWAGRRDPQPRFVGHERSGFDRTGAGDEPPFDTRQGLPDERHGRAETGAVRTAPATYERGAMRAQRDDAHEQREDGQQVEGIFRGGRR